MNNSNSITSNLLQAMSIIAQKTVSSARYDKTIQATIISCIDATVGKYKVRYQDGYWYAYSQATDVTYSPGSTVYVLIPEGDMSNVKTIIGTTQKLGINYVNVQSVEAGYVTVGNNLITNISSNALCSYSTQTEILYDAEDNALNNGTININTAAAQQYIKASSHLMISTVVKTSLPLQQRYGGNYGLKFYLDFKNNSTEETVTRLYLFDVDSMEGNPYLFTNETKQTAFFEVDSQNFIRIKRIEAFVEQFPVQQVGHNDDIFLSEIILAGSNALTSEEQNGVSLHLITKQGYIFTENSLNTDTRTVQAEVRVKMRVIDNKTQNLPFYWFVENTGVTPNSTYYHPYGGQGWKCLNDYSVIKQAVGADPAIVSFNPGSYLFTVAKNDVHTRETKYKCVVVYGQHTFEKEFVIINNDYDYNVRIVSDSGTQFSYDIGNPTLTCIVESQIDELDSDDFTFVWSKEDNNGSFSSLPQTTILNNNYQTLISEYEVFKEQLDQEEIAYQGTYSGTTTNAQHLADLQAQIQAYADIQRVSAATIYNVDIKQITNFNIFKCSVFVTNTGALVGTASITIVNKLVTDGLYKVVINNGSQVFNYSQSGVSPASEAFEHPYEIPSLSFTIYDDKGNAIADNIANKCKVEWIVPIQNTMLYIPASYEGQLTQDGTKKVYKNYMNLVYQINNKYYTNRTNNTIQLKVQYNQLNLMAETNLTFTKQGQSGTNGTEYQVKIVPYITAGNFSDYPTVTIWNNNVITNWTHPDGTGNGRWFKVELWHNGEKIFDSNISGNSEQSRAVSIEWGVISNSYSSLLADSTCIAINNTTGFITFDGSSLDLANYVPSNIVKATVKYDGLTYYATMPVISVKKLSSSTVPYQASLKKNTGFRYAIYNDDGTQASYDNHAPFEIIVTKLLSNGNYEDVSLNTINDITSYTWNYLGTHYDKDIHSWVNKTYLGNDTIHPAVAKNQRWVKPLDNYDGQVVNSAIAVTIAVSNINVLYVHIPVHLYVNRYNNKTLNGWDGNTIELGGNNDGAIIAPQVGAGYKQQDNSFTGIVMGKVRGDSDGTKDIESGLFGYKSGERTIFLDADTGKAVFGKNNAGQIILDPSNSQAVIRGGNYVEATDSTPGSGMQIDLTTPSIKYGSGNFIVDADGHVTLRGATLEGDSTTIENLDELVAEVVDFSSLQQQIDAKIDTWCQSTNPAVAWTTQDLRDVHDGDLWFYTGTTNLTAGSTTIQPSKTYQYNGTNNTWTLTNSPTRSLFDYADGKSTVYYGTTSDTFNNLEVNDYLVDNTDGCTYRWTGLEWVKVTDYETAIQTAIDSLQTTLQNQIDAKIETWCQNTDPSTAWTTGKLKAEHNGDLWYYTGTSDLTVNTVTIKPSKTYQYNSSTNKWVLYNSPTTSLFDVADGKTTIYYGTTSGTYSNVQTGDYLVDNTDGSTYRWNGSTWIKVTDYATAISTATSALQSALQVQIDGKIQTWRQSTNPALNWTTTQLKNKHDGDLWCYTGTTTSTYTQNATYMYVASNNSWVAYSATDELFDAVDGKSTIYYGTTSDTYSDVQVNDYLVDSTDGCTYKWDGSAWTKVTDYTTAITSAVSSLQTTLENQIDAKLQTWCQNTNPASGWTTNALKAEHNGDLWYYTGTTTLTIDSVSIQPSKTYQYNSTTGKWVLYNSPSRSLFDFADGKSTIYYGTTSGTYSNVTAGDYLVDSTDGCTYRWTGSAWTKVTDYAGAITTATNTLQAQIDGKIQSWTGSAVPTLSNYPANQWDTNTKKNAHLGDIYYDGNGKCYRFQYENSVYSWKLITDADLTRALSDSADALSGVTNINGLLVSDYYTKTQTDSQITAAQGRLTSTMSSNYTSLVAYKSGFGNNLLPYPYYHTPATGHTRVTNGVTFTDNEDGTITATSDGPASANANFMFIYDDYILSPGTYTLSGCPSGGSDNTYCMRVATNSGNTILVTDTGNGGTFTVNADTTIRAYIRIASGTTVTNLIFKPMLEQGQIAHTYTPYADSIGGVQASVKVTDDKVSTLQQTVDGFATTVAQTYTTKTEFGQLQQQTISQVISEYAKNQSATTAPSSRWSTTVPTWEDGYYIWARTRTKYVDTSKQDSVSSPVCLTGAKGQTGSEAPKTAVVYLYKRSGSAATIDWVNNVEYTFSTQTISAATLPSGWYQDIPSGTDPIYVTAATAYGTGTTDSIAANEWSTPVVLARNGADGSGANAFTIILTNEAHSFPKIPSGGSSISTTTTVLSYDGTNPVTPTIGTITGVPTGMSTSVSNSTITITITSAFETTTGQLTIPITVTNANNNTVTFYKNFSWSLVQNGQDGETPIVYSLEASTSAIVKDKAGTKTPSSFTVYGYSQTGASVRTAYAGRFKIEGSNNGSSYTSLYTSSSNESSHSYTLGTEYKIYKISLYKAGGTTTLLDQQTIPLVVDGTDGTNGVAYQLIVNNPIIVKDANGDFNVSTITLTAKSNTGTSYTDYSGRFKIYTTTNNTSWTSRYTSSSNESSYTYTIPTGIIGIRCQLYLAGGTTTLLDRQTVPVVSDGQEGTSGINTATVYLYQRAASSPNKPSGSLTYTFSTGDLAETTSGSGALGNWSQTIPSGSDPCWITLATANSNAATDDIASTEWSDVVKLVENGATGASGYNQATIFLYQRAASAPNKPGSLTYTFSSGTLSGSIGDWTRTVPAVNGNTCWVTTAAAISQDATVSLSGDNWSTVSQLVQDGKDAYTVILTNQNHTFAGTTNAAIASSTICRVIAYKGTTQVAATIGTITGFPSGMTVSQTNNGTTNAQFSVSVTTSMTTANGTLSIPVTVDGVSFTKIFTYSVAFAGASGDNGYTVLLTNEAHSFAGTANGAAIAGSTTTSVLAYKGSTQKTPTIGTISGKPTGMTTSVSGTTITITVTTSLTTRSGSLTIPITVDGITFNKTFSWSVNPAGTNGTSAVQYYLQTDTSVITKNKTGTLSPSGFTVYGYSKTGNNNAVSYSGRFKIEGSNDGSTYTSLYTSSANESSHTYTISSTEYKIYKATLYQAGGTSTQLDVQTIPMVVDGSDGSNGVDGYNQATITLYQRASSAPSTPTATPTYTFSTGALSAVPSGWSRTVPSGNNPCYVTSTSVISRTDQATVSSWSGVVKLVQDGEKGDTGKGIASVADKYCLSNSTTAPAYSSFTDGVKTPTASNRYLWSYQLVTYTDNSTAQLDRHIVLMYSEDGAPGKGISSIVEKYAKSSTTTEPNDSAFGTSAVVPDSTDRYVWNYETITFTDNTTQSTAKHIIGVYGDTGLDGAQFWTTTTAPTTPNYTFTISNLTGDPNASIKVGDIILYSYYRYTVSTVSSTTVYATNRQSLRGAAGAAGAAGINTATVYLYKRSVSQPTVPSSQLTYTFSTKTLANIPGDWQQTIPTTGTDPVWLTIATASANTSTDTIAGSEWSSAIKLEGIDGQNGSDGDDGLNTASIFLYKRASTTPSKPTSALTYTFATGVLSGGNLDGWSQTIPAVDGNPCYVIQATAISADTTYTIPASGQGTWSAVSKLVQDGQDGKNIVYNLLHNTANPVISPIEKRININGDYESGYVSGNQGSNSVLYVTEHGFGNRVTSAGRPYLRFGLYDTTDHTEHLYGLTPGNTYTMSFDWRAKLFSGSSFSSVTSSYILGAVLYTLGQNESSFSSTRFITLHTYSASDRTDVGVDLEGTGSGSFTIPSDCVSFYICIIPNSNTSSYFASGDYIEASNIKLEEGSQATAWAPSQEEMYIKTNRNIMCGTANDITIPFSMASSYTWGPLYSTYNCFSLDTLGFSVGEKITLSFDWQASADTYGTFRIQARAYNGEGTSYDAFYALFSFDTVTLSSSNNKGHFISTITLTADYLKTYALTWRQDNAVNQILHISNLKLEKGSIATDWCSADEDALIISSGNNLITGTNSTTELVAVADAIWEKGGWRSAGSGTGNRTIITLHPDSTNINYNSDDIKVKPITKGFNITSTAFDNRFAQMNDIGQEKVPIIPKKFYTISCYAKGSGWLAFAVGMSTYAVNRFVLDNVTSWTKYSYSFYLPDKSVFISNNLTRVFFGVTGEEADISFCGMKLEQGLTATQWIAAQEEYSNTKQVQSKIEQKADQITASVQSTYTSKEDYSKGAANNLLPYPYEVTTTTMNGITFTANDDGTITVNGTASAMAYAYFISPQSNPFYLGEGTYTLTGCPEGGGSNTYRLTVAYRTTGASSNTGLAHDYGNGRTVVVSSEVAEYPMGMYIRIESGQTVNNLVFKPMFQRGTIAHNYVSYANSQASNAVVSSIEQRVSSAQLKITDEAIVSTVENSQTFTTIEQYKAGDVDNLIPYPYDTQSGYSQRGVTWTVDQNTGIITADSAGVAPSGTSYFTLFKEKKFPLEAGQQYTLSIDVEGGTCSVYFAHYDSNNTNLGQVACRAVTNTHDEVTFTAWEDEYTTNTLALYIGTSNGVQNNTKIKVMLEKGMLSHAYIPSVHSRVVKNKIISTINQTAESVTIDAGKINLNGAVTANNYFKINTDGSMEAVSGKIGGWSIGSTEISKTSAVTAGTSSTQYKARIFAPSSVASGNSAFAIMYRSYNGGDINSSSSYSSWSWPFYVNYDGFFHSEKGTIGGWTIDTNSIYKEVTISGIKYTPSLYAPNTPVAGNMAFGISKVEGTSTTYPFCVHYNGQLDATNIQATGGKIGGWSLTSTALYNGSLAGNSSGYAGLSTADFTRTINGTSRTGLRLAIGSNFGVSNTGVLYAGSVVISGAITATSGSFTGSIYASSGTVGGWTIGSASIYSNPTSSRYVYLNNGTGTNGDVLVVRNGTGTTADPYTWPFYVRADGTLVASKATITGTITSSSASITGGSININASSASYQAITLKYTTSKLSATMAPNFIMMDDNANYVTTHLRDRGITIHTDCQLVVSEASTHTCHLEAYKPGTSGVANANIGKSFLDINYIKYYDSLTNASDRRFKTNIKPISYEQASDLILNAKPVSYELIDSPINVHHGMVAQDIKKYVNIQKNWSLVQEDKEGYLSLNYIEMIPDMIVVIQQLVREIEKLKQKVV